MKGAVDLTVVLGQREVFVVPAGTGRSPAVLC